MTDERFPQQSEDEREAEADIAVIGMAGRFAGARDLEQFWANLAAGVESIAFLTDEELAAAGVDPAVRHAPGYVPATSRLEDADCFDAALFGYTPREAALMDPQSRVCLELAWHALEDAGCSPLEYAGSIGVFASTSLNTYLLYNLRGQLDPQDFILGLGNIPVVVGNAGDFVATRLSYKLNLRGPSVAVQTACSSSLTAIHLARQSLLSGECDVALAGGVSIYLPRDRGYLYQDGMILSPDGHCRAFDADADGIVFGRGGGMVVLKSLARAREDGDRVRAVIKGSAVNNDGSRKVGFTAPSVTGQSRVIAEALADAGLRADSISYVEAHGTGTKLGDPIEIAALTEAYRKHTARSGYCALGTVKTNIGHLDVAAGVAGFIKTVLMLEHRQLPPSLHFRRPNPVVDFASSPFFVNTSLRPWQVPSGSRRAGVSAFGIGGTNVHLILEEAPAPADRPRGSELPAHVMRVTGRTEDALATLCTGLAERLGRPDAPDLGDACFTANTGRAHLPHRVVVRGTSATDLREGLEAAASGRDDPRVVRGQVAAGEAPPVAFLFAGLGAQSVGMGHALYETQPVFRAALERCDALLRPHLDRPLLQVLYPGAGEPSPIDQTTYGQPVLFAFEYALAMLWQAWGVRPAAVLGHSLGEYGAACVAGLLPLEEALRLVATRARLADTLPAGGGMAAVLATEAQVQGALGSEAGQVSIASLNGPESMVLSGAAEALGRVAARLTAQQVDVRILKVTQAFHSAWLEPMLDRYEAAVAQTRFGRARIPIISNVTGAVLTEAEGRDARYWRRHAREVVRFADGVQTLYERGIRHFVEMGPHTTATGMAAGCITDEGAVFLPSLRRERGDWDQLLESLSELYVRGVPVDWEGLYAPSTRRRAALPLYPFARTRHWIEPAAASPATDVGTPGQPMLGRAVRSPLFDEPAYEIGIDVEAHPFLGDHRVLGATVFPATGYIEAALEAAAQATGRRVAVVEDLEITEALTVAEAGKRLAQVVLKAKGDDSRFEIFAMAGTGEADHTWRRYGTGRVTRGAAAEALRGDRLAGDAIRARCGAARSGEAFYDGLALLGFEYGPSFRGIQAVWTGDGEVLGEVRLPAPIEAEAGAYRFHPALLDSCLQVVLGLVPSGRTFLPIRFGRVVVGDWQPDLLVHAVLRPAPEGSRTLHCDVRIAARSGEVIAEVGGIVLEEVDPRRWAAGHPRGRDSWLYEISWRPAPLAPEGGESPALPPPARLGAVMREQLESLRQLHDLAGYETVQADLDRACSQYALSALQALGWKASLDETFTTPELCRRLSIAPQHERMTRRLLEMLAEDGLLERAGAAAWRVRRQAPATAPAPDLEALRGRYPHFGKMFEMVERCGLQLAAGLRGEVKAVDLLFPGGSLADLENLYQKSPFALAYNELVAAAVTQLVASLGNRGTLRVLEIGAGTGGTTASILPRLPAERTRYVFTDVSQLFLARAEERFAAYPFVEYHLLDAGADPGAQGFAPGTFDLVVASNVLHATASLRQTIGGVRRLLAPGGLLVLVEGVARQRWVDLLFGLTDGWWKFTDADVRSDYPLMSQGQWSSLLSNEGFGEFVAIPGEERPAALFHQAVMVAKRLEDVRSRWLIVDDGEHIGAGVAEQLRAHGGSATVVSTDGASQALRGVLDSAEGGCRLDAVVLCDDLTAAAPAGSSDRLAGTRALLSLVQGLAAHPAASSARLWVVTRGVQRVTPGDEVPGVSSAPLWGLAQVVSLEHPELRCACIDLEPGDDAPGGALWDELSAGSRESRIAIRGGRRYVARLTRVPPPAAETPLAAGAVRRLESSEPGLLDALRYVDAPRRQPGPGQVEIRVRVAGLNFKDVLTALGRFPGGPGALGHECAGEIAGVGPGVEDFSVGDAVVAFAPGSLATHVIADVRLVARKPPALSFEQGATIAGGFLTAHHALHDLARIGAGDRILIHAATGGVGLAAVQLAQRAGAEIFATAGSDAKRALLRSLGVPHVFSSRTPEFADAIERMTEGQGVSIVLNSLTGEVLERSVAVLGAAGRFVELGRGSAPSAQAQERLGRGAAYFTPDVASECLADPARFGPVLRELLAAVERGEITPLPHRAFEAADVVAAFRLMARAGHIGKVVVRQGAAATGAEVRPAGFIAPDATYLIVGGLGGLGLLVAERLVEHGARHLALMSRRGPGVVEQAVLARLAERGVRVLVIAGDVSRRADVARAMARIREEGPPLRGVVQAAGVLDDGVLAQQTWERFSHVMAPKVDGSWLLHEAVEGMPLDFFIMFSSVASLLGSAGQGNHAAANAFLDALAFHRQARGLPGLSINWGAWSSVGAAARRKIGGRIAARGLGEIAPDEGLATLDHLLAWPRPQVGVVPVDWQVFRQQFPEGQDPPFVADLLAGARVAVRPDRKPATDSGFVERVRQAAPGERRALVSQFVRGQVVKGLGLDPAQPIDSGQPLSSLGVDSLLAVELRNALSRGLGLKTRLSATLLFDFPSIGALTEHLVATLVDPVPAPIPVAAAPSAAAKADEGEIAALTDEEAEALLLEELEQP